MNPILGKIFGGGAKDLAEGVVNVVDKFVTTDEERLKAEKEIKDLVMSYQMKVSEEISRRWEADMSSDSWLSKNIRPLGLIYMLLMATLFTLLDFGYIEYEVKDSWIDFWQALGMIAVGAYYGGRAVNKGIKFSATKKRLFKDSEY